MALPILPEVPLNLTAWLNEHVALASGILVTVTRTKVLQIGIGSGSKSKWYGGLVHGFFFEGDEFGRPRSGQFVFGLEGHDMQYTAEWDSRGKCEITLWSPAFNGNLFVVTKPCGRGYTHRFVCPACHRAQNQVALYPKENQFLCIRCRFPHPDEDIIPLREVRCDAMTVKLREMFDQIG